MKHVKLGGPIMWLTFICLLCIGVDVYNGVTTGWDKWNFIALAFVLLLYGYAVIKTLRTPVHVNVNPNQHTAALCENCDWTCVHDIAPDAKTGQCAWPIAHRGIPEPTPAQRRIKKYKTRHE